MEYNILLVEDDAIQRKNLALMIQELDYKLNIYEAGSIEAALEVINDVDIEIDLFYLDQILPDGLGIDLGRQIRTSSRYKLSWIIFLTSHVQYMLEAFKEIHCYDYILKPYSKEEVKNLTHELIEGTHKSKSDLSNDERGSIDFQVNGIKMKLFTDQIYFIEVNLRTCLIHTTTGVYKVKKTPLHTMIEKLPNEIFFQSHRAYLVNTDYINSIYQYKGSWMVSFKDYDKTALIGRTFKGKLIEFVENKSIHLYGN